MFILRRVRRLRRFYLILVIVGIILLKLLLKKPYCYGRDIIPAVSLPDVISTVNPWERSNLLDIPSFQWIMNNAQKCDQTPRRSPDPTKILAVLVHSARNHSEYRRAIRRSWGSIPVYKNFELRLVFLLGEADPAENPAHNQRIVEEQTELEREDERFHDLVMGNFVDSYRNMTYKHLMGYKWILNFCQEAVLVLKVDDDQFIDIVRWIDWRVEDTKDPWVSAPDLYCRTFQPYPIRDEESKWAVTCDEWSKDSYPEFCSGCAYGISVNLIRELYAMTTRVPFFWIDDIYATGVLLEALKQTERSPKMKDISPWVTWQTEDREDICEVGSWEKNWEAVAYVPKTGNFTREMMCMWIKTVHHTPHYPKY